MWVLNALFVSSVVAAFALLLSSIVEYTSGDYQRGRTMLWAGAATGITLALLTAAGALSL
jgi:hypothetical protein